MEKKMKSANDVWKQALKCNDLYNPFDNTKKGTSWLKVMWKIYDFYSQNIFRQIELNHPKENPEKYYNEKFSYSVRTYMPDTSLEVIHSLKPWKKEGLYCVMDDGEIVVPTRIYFGIDTRLFRKDGNPCGRAYYHYCCALHPVLLPDGTQYREPNLSNVCCSYKDGLLYNFYRE